MGWLGEVPEHWEVRRLKQICRLAYGDSLTTDVRQEGIVPVFGSNGRVGFHNSANTEAPCIVIGRKGSFGKVNYSRVPVFAIDTTFFVDSRFSSAHIRWLFFLLIWLRLDDVTKDSAIPGLDREDAYQRLAAVPPLPEQTAITRYLDYTDRRIQRYIRAKQRLITLLEEQKRAIIHQAVTRGLDPNVPTKPTGNSWFPKVPVHWNVMPMRRVVTRVVDGPHHSPDYLDQGIPFLSARNIKVGRWSLEDVKFISQSDYDIFCQRVKPEVGDVLYTKGGTTGVARAVDLDYPFQVWVHVAVLKPRKDRVLPRYLAVTLNTPRCYEQSQLLTRGATNQDLGLGRMKEIVLPVPPLSDQSKIIERVVAIEEKIGRGIQAASRHVDLLSEYRTRLISDVVTGKLDVREAAAALPEVDPLEIEDDSEETLEPTAELAEEFEAIAEGT